MIDLGALNQFEYHLIRHGHFKYSLGHEKIKHETFHFAA